MESRRVSPIITLTTDFGLSDHYVGTMKGVILSRCPDAQIVDICHELPPFSIWSGAYAIAQAAPYFPLGTLHLAVIDPGVGSERKPILAEAAGQYFVAPDNGVLTFILEREAGAEVREITNRDLFLSPVSSTFHGRDIFAPVAGTLAARQVAAQDVGPIFAPQMLAPLLPVRLPDGGWEGRVLSIDRFGNVVTNFMPGRFAKAAVEAGQHRIDILRETFSQGLRDEIFIYSGSSGYLEIGMNQASAASKLNLRPGDSVRLIDS